MPDRQLTNLEVIHSLPKWKIMHFKSQHICLSVCSWRLYTPYDTINDVYSWLNCKKNPLILPIFAIDESAKITVHPLLHFFFGIGPFFNVNLIVDRHRQVFFLFAATNWNLDAKKQNWYNPTIPIYFFLTWSKHRYDGED